MASNKQPPLNEQLTGQFNAITSIGNHPIGNPIGNPIGALNSPQISQLSQINQLSQQVNQLNPVGQLGSVNQLNRVNHHLNQLNQQLNSINQFGSISNPLNAAAQQLNPHLTAQVHPFSTPAGQFMAGGDPEKTTTTAKKKAKHVKKDAISKHQFNYQSLNVNLNPKERIVQDQSLSRLINKNTESANSSLNNQQLQFKIVQPNDQDGTSLKLKIATTRKPGTGNSELRKLRIPNPGLIANNAVQTTIHSLINISTAAGLQAATASSTVTSRSGLTSPKAPSSIQSNVQSLQTIQDSLESIAPSTNRSTAPSVAPLKSPHQCVQPSLPTVQSTAHNVSNSNKIRVGATGDSFNKKPPESSNPLPQPTTPSIHINNLPANLNKSLQIANKAPSYNPQHPPTDASKNKVPPADPVGSLSKQQQQQQQLIRQPRKDAIQKHSANRAPESKKVATLSSSSSSSSTSSSRSSSCSKSSSSSGASSNSSSSSGSRSSSSSYSSSSNSCESNCSSKSSSSNSSRSASRSSCETCVSSRSSSSSSSSDEEPAKSRGRSRQKADKHSSAQKATASGKADQQPSRQTNRPAEKDQSTQQLLNSVNESLINHQKQKLSLNQLNVASPFSPSDLPSPLNSNLTGNHLNSQPSSVSCESNCYSPSVSINSPSCQGGLKKNSQEERQRLRSYRLPTHLLKAEAKEKAEREAAKEQQRAKASGEDAASAKDPKADQTAATMPEQSTSKKTKKQKLKGEKKKGKVKRMSLRKKKPSQSEEAPKEPVIKTKKSKDPTKKKEKKLKQADQGTKEKKLKKKGKKKGKGKKGLISEARLADNSELAKSLPDEESRAKFLLMNANLNMGIPPNIDKNVILPDLSRLIKEDRSLLLKQSQLLLHKNLANPPGDHSKECTAPKPRESQQHPAPVKHTDKSPDSGIQSQSESPVNQATGESKRGKRPGGAKTNKPISQTPSGGLSAASKPAAVANVPKDKATGSQVSNLQEDPMLSQFLDNTVASHPLASLLENLQKSSPNLNINSLLNLNNPPAISSAATTASSSSLAGQFNPIGIKPQSLPSELISLTEILLNLNKNKDPPTKSPSKSPAAASIGQPSQVQPNASHVPSSNLISSLQQASSLLEKKQKRSKKQSALSTNLINQLASQVSSHLSSQSSNQLSSQPVNQPSNRPVSQTSIVVSHSQPVGQPSKDGPPTSNHHLNIKNLDLWRSPTIANSPLMVDEVNKRLRTSTAKTPEKAPSIVAPSKGKPKGRRAAKKSVASRKDQEPEFLPSVSTKELNKSLALNAHLKKSLLSDLLCVNEHDETNSNQQLSSRSVSSLSQNYNAKDKKRKKKHKSKKSKQDGQIKELNDEVLDRDFLSLTDNLAKMRIHPLKDSTRSNRESVGVFRCIKYSAGKSRKSGKSKQSTQYQFNNSPISKSPLVSESAERIEKADKASSTKKRKKNSSFSSDLQLIALPTASGKQHDKQDKQDLESVNSENANEHSLPLKKRHHRHTENKELDSDLIDSSTSSSTDLSSIKISLRKSGKAPRKSSAKFSSDAEHSTSSAATATQLVGAKSTSDCGSQINSCALTWVNSNRTAAGDPCSEREKQQTLSPFSNSSKHSRSANVDGRQSVSEHPASSSIGPDESEADQPAMMVTRNHHQLNGKPGQQSNARKLRSNQPAGSKGKMGAIRSKSSINSSANGDLNELDAEKPVRPTKTAARRTRNESSLFSENNSNPVQIGRPARTRSIDRTGDRSLSKTSPNVSSAKSSSPANVSSAKSTVSSAKSNSPANASSAKSKSKEPPVIAVPLTSKASATNQKLQPDDLSKPVIKKRKKPNRTGFDKPKKKKKLPPRLVFVPEEIVQQSPVRRETSNLAELNGSVNTESVDESVSKQIDSKANESKASESKASELKASELKASESPAKAKSASPAVNKKQSKKSRSESKKDDASKKDEVSKKDEASKDDVSKEEIAQKDETIQNEEISDEIIPIEIEKDAALKSNDKKAAKIKKSVLKANLKSINKKSIKLKKKRGRLPKLASSKLRSAKLTASSTSPTLAVAALAAEPPATPKSSKAIKLTKPETTTKIDATKTETTKVNKPKLPVGRPPKVSTATKSLIKQKQPLKRKLSADDDDDDDEPQKSAKQTKLDKNSKPSLTKIRHASKSESARKSTHRFAKQPEPSPEPIESAASPSDDFEEIVLKIHSVYSTTLVKKPKQTKQIKMKGPIKRYLKAGLFSDTFKEDPPSEPASTTNTSASNTPVHQCETPILEETMQSDNDELSPFKDLDTATNSPSNQSNDAPHEDELKEGKLRFEDKDAQYTNTNPIIADDEFSTLLPPPCYVYNKERRKLNDFVLPFDIWWQHVNNQLSHTVNPAKNYKKIKGNVFFDVKPTSDFEEQSCMCEKPKDPSQPGCTSDCLNRAMWIECNPNLCPCGDQCSNQKLLKNQWAPGLERFLTRNRGWGVRTVEPIKKSTFIIEYIGEIVSEKTFIHRMTEMYSGDSHHYCLNITSGIVIDGYRMANEGRFVNHSCEPNCEMQKWSVNGYYRVGLFAKRDIQPGEEVTYDYNFYNFNLEQQQTCHCGSAKCRGVIGGKAKRENPAKPDASTNLNSMEKLIIVKSTLKRSANKRKDCCLSKIENSGTFESGSLALDKKKMHELIKSFSYSTSKHIRKHGVFLIRNFESFRRLHNKNVERKRRLKSSALKQDDLYAPTNKLKEVFNPLYLSTDSRSIRTRGYTKVQDSEECIRMYKLCNLFSEVCKSFEEQVKAELPQDPTLETVFSYINELQCKKSKTETEENAVGLSTIGRNIFSGSYKTEESFKNEITKLFKKAGRHFEAQASTDKVQHLEQLFNRILDEQMREFNSLNEIADEQVENNEKLDDSFELNKSANKVHLSASLRVSLAALTNTTKETSKLLHDESNRCNLDHLDSLPVSDLGAADCESQELQQLYKEWQLPKFRETEPTDNDEVIRCICTLTKDDGTMIQCDKCRVWQHAHCMNADVEAETYLCERCDSRECEREIKLEKAPVEGVENWTYYFTFTIGENVIKIGDTVYLERERPKNENNEQNTKRNSVTFIDFDGNTMNKADVDIFRIEHLYKTPDGKKHVYGHHCLRPSETYHEPTRKFFSNEVLSSPLGGNAPLEAIKGKCHVLDLATFCKGRPVDARENDVYVCEFKVDKKARSFSKISKGYYAINTAPYCFNTFEERLHPKRTFSPHNAAMLKKEKKEAAAKQEKPQVIERIPPPKVEQIELTEADIANINKLHLRTFVQKQFNINKIVEKINKLNEENSDEEDDEMDCSPVEPKKSDQTDEPTAEEPMTVEPTTEGSTREGPKEEKPKDTPAADDSTLDEPMAVESTVDESKEDQSKQGDSKQDQSNEDRSKVEPKADESNVDESKTDEPKANGSKTDESKADKSKVDESKADEKEATPTELEEHK